MRPIKNAADRKTALVVKALAASPAVSGIICFGSRAIGRDDERSDIDLYVFGQERLPRKSIRARCFQSLPGISDLQLDYPGSDRQWWPQQDRFRIGKLTFDLAYSAIDRICTIVRKVKEGKTSIPELRFRPYTMPGLLANSVVLYDRNGSLARMIRDVYPYPARLRQVLIRTSLAALDELLEELRDTARRQIGQTAFLFHLAFMNSHLSTLLHTINGKYDPATKRVEQDFGMLQALPHNFLARYKALLTGPFDQRGQLRAAEEYGRFIKEARSLASRPKGKRCQ